jgi:GNAT superfamily N-acetyltransferase
MIRACTDDEFETIAAIINDAAEAYRGVIPADCWKEPYMPDDELAAEIARGVRIWGFEADGELQGVMGTEDVKDVTLIRHAYVRTARRNRGVGAALLAHLRGLTERPLLIGTWAAADWAVGFYRKHDFRVLTGAEKDRLLRIYWTVPKRQMETSVVLACPRWPGD